VTGPARILVVNAGSSSLKLRVLDGDDAVVGSADLGPIRTPDDATAVLAAIGQLGPVDASGHRVVHGGTRFTGPARLDDDAIAAIGALVELAPLHQPAALAGIEAIRRALPGVPAIASFDTAFHAGLPPAASTYALPAAWRERWAIRRYGFHGLSHAYASRRAAELLGVPAAELRIVTCHLGAGASLAAVRDGRSVDTTMGFTPLEGLAMATRSGSVDPGLVLWLAEHGGLAMTEIEDGLELASGMLGLAGTADMREVVSRSSAGEAPAVLALGVYLHRLRASIAAMAASLGGIDALVFTGGVGERSAPVRAMAVDGLAFLGLAVDPARNEADEPDRLISPDGATARVLVVVAREDLEIAREVRAVLAARPSGGR
jgi:acetate kinase